MLELVWPLSTGASDSVNWSRTTGIMTTSLGSFRGSFKCSSSNRNGWPESVFGASFSLGHVGGQELHPIEEVVEVAVIEEAHEKAESRGFWP